MRRVIATVLACLLSAQSVTAGAWLRDSKQGFVAFSTTRRSATPNGGSTNEFSLYAEYGAFTHLTPGLDINESPGASGHALIFARFPLGSSTGRRKLAVELGIGAHHAGAIIGAMTKATLSWGVGFSGPGGGWLAVDSAIEYRARSGGPIYKLDATLGFPSRRRLRPMLQLETSLADGSDPSWALIPSLILTGRSGRRWVLGLEARSAATRTLGLKLSLWQRF